MNARASEPLRRAAVTLDELWAVYADGGGSARERARESLLTRHLGLVHFVARQIARGLSPETELDELVSAGTLGLIGALESFDRSRGLAFSTFAAPRIRGSILDELRRQDHVSRSVRWKSRALRAAREALMRTLGREPADHELATQLGLDIPRVWRWRSEVEGAVLVSLERPVGDRDEESAAARDFLHSGEPGVDEVLNHEQEVSVLAAAIAALNEQQRIVLTLYYYEELKLNEIATVLGVTESRVSQIRSKALARLRAEMAPRLDAVA